MAVLISNEVVSSEATWFPSLRKEMVERDIVARGVRDELVLDAMRRVPRELFLPKTLREFAYEDSPLPIEGEQTISQPYIVAFVVDSLMLKGGESSQDWCRFRIRRSCAVGDRGQCLHGGAAWVPRRTGRDATRRARL